jgi:ABC-2 type transport system permease protein
VSSAPSPTAYAVRCGLSRGRIEFSNSLKSGQDIGYYIVTSAIFVIVLYLNRDSTVDGTDTPLTLYMLPGVLALMVFVSGAYGVASALAAEREDGTLLRLKSVPYGVVGYVTGHALRVSLEIAFSMVLVLVPALFIVPGLFQEGPGSALGTLGYIALGLIAVLPLGFVIGSIFRNPRSVGGWGMLVLGVAIWLSGIFYPLSLMAGWMQVVGQLLPTYWLGLGLRSTMLPNSAVVVEIGESWRTFATVGVLIAWAAVGLALAPVLLRRMARRESGSAVAARREKQLQRV